MHVVGVRRVPARVVSGTFGTFSGWGGGGGGGGIRTSFILRPCAKDWCFFSACSPLCTTYCTRMWNKKSITSVHAFRDRAQKHRYFTAFYAQNTDVFTAFSPLCTTCCSRMWNKKIYHKRPCLSRPCPKTLVFTAFMPETLVFTALKSPQHETHDPAFHSEISTP